MPITTLNDLMNDKIYDDKTETLAQRLDFAWSIYSSETESDQHKDKALEFLMYALDIMDIDDINTTLITLMYERERHKDADPDYIPGKTPENPEMLKVNERSKKLDAKEHTIYLTPQERSKHRVLIVDGHFKQHGKLLDTSKKISHGKKGFVAYTLNAKGELSVFEHHGMRDRMAHSSMNAGSPVVAAGELKIEKGVLKAITSHSGHYQPSLFHMYRALEYLSNQGVDISQTKVITQKNPSKRDFKLHAQRVYYPAYHDYFYETPAPEVFFQMRSRIDQQIHSICSDIKAYTKNFLSMLYHLKDKLHSSSLTTERHALSSQFKEELQALKGAAPQDLETLITRFEEKNERLSRAC
ncbi:MAG: hypothetical protein ACOYKA_06535 [Legionellaceae bacterium]